MCKAMYAPGAPIVLCFLYYYYLPRKKSCKARSLSSLAALVSNKVSFHSGPHPVSDQASLDTCVVSFFPCDYAANHWLRPKARTYPMINLRLLDSPLVITRLAHASSGRQFRLVCYRPGQGVGAS